MTTFRGTFETNYGTVTMRSRARQNREALAWAHYEKRRLQSHYRRVKSFNKAMHNEERREFILAHYPSLSARRSYLRSKDRDDYDSWQLGYPEPGSFWAESIPYHGPTPDDYSFGSVDDIVPESGEDYKYNCTDFKSANRSAKTRSRASRSMERERFKHSQANKEWSAKVRAQLRKDVKKSNSAYRPEAGLCDGSIFGEFDPSHYDLYGKRIEDLFLYLASSTSSQNMQQFVLATITYLKTFSNKSVSLWVLKHIVSIVCGDKKLSEDGSLSEDVTQTWCDQLNDLADVSASDVVDKMSQTVPESATDYSDLFCKALRSLSSNFKSVAANPVFSKISYIISAAMCMGLLENTKIKWSVAGITLFSQQAFLRQVRAPDLICAICDTFTYFIEGGIEFFKTGSLAGFIYSDKRVSELDEEICFLEANVDHVRGGTLLKYKKISNSDFDHRLTIATDKVKELCRALKGVERTIMTQKLTKLYKVKFDFDTLRVAGGSREAPYTICLFGPTKVGKSNLTMVFAVCIGKMNDFSADDDRVANINGDDEYHSTMRGDINIVILDDMFNTKVEFLKKAPTALLGVIKNNNVAYCTMADLEMKGRIAWDCKLLIVNTNIPDMGASQGSNEPASIERRQDLRLDVSVQEQFRATNSHTLDSNKVAAHYAALGIEPPVIEDLWWFKVSEPVVVPNRAVGGKDTVIYRVCVDEAGPMDRVTLPRLLKFIKGHSQNYYAHEANRVVRLNNLSHRIHKCVTCGYVEFCCVCVKTESGLAETSVNELIEIAKKSVVRHMPDCIIGFLVRWYFGVTPVDNYTFHFIRIVLFICCILIGYFFNAYLLPIICTIVLFLEYFVRQYVIVISRIADSKGIITTICKRTRDYRLQTTLMSFGALIMVYHLAKRYVLASRLYNTFAQGSLQPTCEQDVIDRDKEVNVWAKVSVPDRHVPHHLATATIEQVSNCVFNNLCVLRIQEGNEFRICNAFVVRSNLFLMPYHMLFPSKEVNDGKMLKEPDSIQISLQRRTPQTGGAMVMGFVSASHWVRVPKTDFAIVSFPNMGSYADLTKLLPDIQFNGTCLFLHKNKDGTRRQEGVFVKACRTRHIACEFEGYDYTVAGGTTPGLCMSTLITQGVGPHICGFHLGGARNGVGKAVAGFITKQQFEDGVLSLKSKNVIPLFVPASATDIPETQYGKSVITTTDINPKSPVNFLTDSDGIVPLGSCNGGVTAVSRVVKTLITDSVTKYTGVPNIYGRPKFKPAYEPWQKTLEIVGIGAPGFRQESVDWALADYLQPIYDLIDNNEYARNMCRKLTMVQTINGIPGVRFIDAIVSKTSAGFPLNGRKDQFFVHLGPDGEYGDVMLPQEDVLEEIERLKKAYLSNVRGYPVYKASLKDEPTKIGKDKVRVIYCAPLGSQILCRMFFLPITRLFQTHPNLCESAVGINCAGPEWQALREHCTFEGTNLDRGFGVDYSRYDSRMPAQISVAVNRILMGIARHSGMFTEDDLTIMDGILTDTTFPLVAFNGTVVEYLLSLMSGDTLTVHRNNAGNSILQRIGWYEIEVLPRRYAGDTLEDETYRAHVRAANYGDDVEATVKDDVKYFNMKSYAELMGEHGVVVTMPDKTPEMKEFMHWDDLDFLKRSDSYIPEIDAIVGKLEYNSIFKSLHSRLDTKNVSKEEHATAVLEGAAGEFFLHGKEVYDNIITKLILVEQEHNLYVPGLHKTFEDRVTEWNAKYRSDLTSSTERGLFYDSDDPSVCDIVPEAWSGEIDRVPDEVQDKILRYVEYVRLAEWFNQERDRIAEGNRVRRIHDTHVHTVRQVVEWGNLIKFALIGFYVYTAIAAFSRAALSVILVPPNVLDTAPPCAGLQSVYPGIFIPSEMDLEPVSRLTYVCVIGLAHTIRRPGNLFNDCFLKQRGNHSTQTSVNEGADAPTSEDYISSISSQSFMYSDSDTEIIPEAGMSAFSIMDTPNQTTSTITQFSDINPGQTFMMGDNSDGTYAVADESVDDLSSFFKRPIIIEEFSWTPGFPLIQFFNPWRLYLNNPRVSNRMTNYRNMRGRLHLKFTINGNQFMYGLAMAAYSPLPVVDNFNNEVYDGRHIISMSQRPHVYLDPNLSQGADFVCPFFWAYNSIRLNSNDMDNLGLFNLIDVATLRHVQGTTDPVTITVFAWMEEVVLSCPTAAPMDGLVPQSGASDEYGMSPAKKMAEAVARAAGKLSGKPVIGPYAKATQLAASIGLDIASALGYSKPNCIEAVMPMKQINCGSLANTNVPDMTQKLSLDAKQEVSIDPRTVGLTGEDEMDIVALACRESYLTQFQWDQLSIPGTSMFSLRVGPQQYGREQTGLNAAVVMTPSAWVVAPFAYWRGSMKIRVKIVSSSFHKGRLRVVYDPAGSAADEDMNVVTNHIIDLAECKDYTFTIGWNQPWSYCRTVQYDNENGSYNNTPLDNFGEFWNGSIRIDVLSQLTSPSTESDGVNVLIFTSMCEDFEVQGPSSAIIQNLTFFNPNVVGRALEIVPESGVVQDGEDTCAPSMPVLTDEEPEAKLAGGLLATTDQTPNIYFGESIKSWRSVLKRYNLHRGWLVGPNGNANVSFIHDLAIADFPFYRGLCEFGIDDTLDGAYNYCDMTMLNWVTPAYAGYRGSIRWKYATMLQRSSAPNNLLNAHMQVTRTPVGNLGYLNFSTAVTYDLSYIARTIRAQVAHTCSGATFTNRLTNGTVEAELPYQSNRRFYSARRDNPNQVNSEFPSHRLQIVTTEGSSAFMSYCAAGEDFQLYFFVNVPKCWVVVADPTAI